MLLLMIHSSESWRKIVGKLLRGRTKNRREIPMISKYSVFFVETRRINAIFMSKKFSVPLTSESVTSGQAGGVFRQLFLQCNLCVKVFCAFIDVQKQRILNDYRGPGFLDVVWFAIDGRSGGEGGAGARSYNGEKAWSTVNHSIHSVLKAIW